MQATDKRIRRTASLKPLHLGDRHMEKPSDARFARSASTSLRAKTLSREALMDEPAQVDRRTLIGAAWAAPVIIASVAAPAASASIAFIRVSLDQVGTSGLTGTFDITVTVTGARQTTDVILANLFFPDAVNMTATEPIPGLPVLIPSSGDQPGEGQVAYFVSSSRINPNGYTAGIRVELTADSSGSYTITLIGGSIGFADGIGEMVFTV
jgi:hypothetical protein